MITDAFLNLSSAQTLATTGTVVSTNVVDLGSARDIGEGENLYVDFDISTAVVGGTSVQFQVIASASSSMSSPVVIGSSAAIAVASLTANARIDVRINPQTLSTGYEYLAAQYVIVGTNTAGAVNANIVHGIQDGQKFYPSGFAIS